MQTEMAALQGWYPALMYETALEPVMSAVAHITGVSQDAFCYNFHCRKTYVHSIHRFRHFLNLQRSSSGHRHSFLKPSLPPGQWLLVVL